MISLVTCTHIHTLLIIIYSTIQSGDAMAVACAAASASAVPQAKALMFKYLLKLVSGFAWLTYDLINDFN